MIWNGDRPSGLVCMLIRKENESGYTAEQKERINIFAHGCNQTPLPNE